MLQTLSKTRASVFAAALLGAACDTSSATAVSTTTAGGSTTSGTTTGTTPTTSLKCPVATTSSSLLLKGHGVAPPRDLREPPANATRTASGLVWRMLSAGTHPQRPNEADAVDIHFTGWAPSGRMFDSPVPSHHPARIHLRDSTPGWQELLADMHVGEERRVWMPSSLAYSGTPPEGAPTGTLVFDVLLVQILPAGGY